MGEVKQLGEAIKSKYEESVSRYFEGIEWTKEGVTSFCPPDPTFERLGARPQSTRDRWPSTSVCGPLLSSWGSPTLGDAGMAGGGGGTRIRALTARVATGTADARAGDK